MSEPTPITEPTHTHTIWRKRELSRTQKLIGKVKGTPEKNTNNFIIKHGICWARQWEDRLRLTMPLGDKSPEETLADLGALMQDDGINQYWKYVTQVLTDDPRKVEKVEQIK
ncbi:uncharacterized protein FSUBG_9558 [Fusarium subglutinans]|uniref:Uncharacterized protein n=1 Tax=Gibberella subglutinans TaxID=42677 RepID=A0A8H5UNS0_GIBSU|nr:uncharacterized protein FSUBG_9558 [Fusarium subglutinans]KAF5594136.1 hypothetical protein FSUBG_9558 [Fusarium subglutinans]